MKVTDDSVKKLILSHIPTAKFALEQLHALLQG